jgi:hypothetical protein
VENAKQVWWSCLPAGARYEGGHPGSMSAPEPWGEPMQDGHFYLWMIATWLGGLLVIVLVDAIKEWRSGRLTAEAFYPELPKDFVPDERMTAIRRIFE